MTTSQSSPFIRNLASSSRTTRDRALTQLRTYLTHKKDFSDLDFLKLWKGLFFSMWMSDKPKSQQRLAIDLGSLFQVLYSSEENFLGFARAFWQTMSREWGGIDALRMDKFLFLVRRVVGEGFAFVASKGWKKEGLLERYLAVLEEVPLSVRDVKVPNGLRFHVVDIWVDELEKADAEHKAPVQLVLTPLRVLSKESPTKSVRKRVGEALEDERLGEWEGGLEKKPVEEESTFVEGKASNLVEAESEDEEFTGFED